MKQFIVWSSKTGLGSVQISADRMSVDNMGLGIYILRAYGDNGSIIGEWLQWEGWMIKQGGDNVEKTD